MARLRPYYDEAGIVIYHGDARELLPSLEADLVLSDPPYGIGFVKGASGQGGHVRRNVHGPMIGDDQPFDPSPLLRFPRAILWGADHYAQRLPEGGRFLAWDKLDGLESFDSFSDVEFAWDSAGGAARIFRLLWKGICQGDRSEQGVRLHPTQKPLPLMRWCLSLAPDAELVLDPYCGSGTTLRAAKDLGRRAIGIELVEEYCEAAARRLAQEVLPL